MVATQSATGNCYSRLGSALNRKDVWLVRHRDSQQLGLLQSFSNPSEQLSRLLSSGDPQLPRVQDRWMENGLLYVVWERVSGAGLEELGPRRVFGQVQSQLRRLSKMLQTLGMHSCPTNTLCLSPDGIIRLRCFPAASKVVAAATTSVALSWSGRLVNFLFGSLAA